MQQTWADLHNALKAFLNGDGATECVLVKVKDAAKTKGGTFSTEMARVITAYNADGAHNNDIYYFGGCSSPTIAQCAGKVVILHDGKWAGKKVWRNLNPVMWADENYGKGDDAITWSANHRDRTNPTGTFTPF